MITPKPVDGEEPFFITEEIEAEMIAAGYVFEAPAHFQKVRDHDLSCSQDGATQMDAVMKIQPRG